MISNLSNIIATTGLLLTLITFLFNLFWQKIKTSLEQDIHITGPDNIKRTNKKVKNTLLFTSIPILISFTFLFYVNLPTTIEIIKISHVKLWNFNVENTLFVMIEIALFSFTLFNVYVVYRLGQIVKSLKV